MSRCGRRLAAADGVLHREPRYAHGAGSLKSTLDSVVGSGGLYGKTHHDRVRVAILRRRA